MSTIFIEKMNEVHVRVFSTESIEADLCDALTFYVDGYKFMPKFRAGLWDGKIYLYQPFRKTLYAGLVYKVKEYAEQNGHKVEFIEEPKITLNKSEIHSFVNSLNIHSKGAPITVRDYQLTAIHESINRQRATILSPTASGKSCILYSLIRWHVENNRKCLLIVPTASLVEQMYTDFQDYSSHNEWSVEENCHRLYSGFSRNFEKNVLISTWQSLAMGKGKQLTKEWYSQFDAVFIDECHLASASSLTGIMEKMVNTKYRIGTTGTLSNSKTNSLVIEGIFGQVLRVITTKELIDQKSLSDLKINALVLKYSEEEKKYFAKNKINYQTEIKYLTSHQKRNKFIRNLALRVTGNTLLQFRFVETHGKVLYDMLQDKAGDTKKIYFIHGNVEVEERELVRKILTTESNAVVVASEGTMSTGTNIPSIENIIFASPTKSKVRNLQSIGRGLRLNKDKEKCTLFDLTDDLSYKKYKNHTLLHGAERYKLYCEEQFDVKLLEINFD